MRFLVHSSPAKPVLAALALAATLLAAPAHSAPDARASAEIDQLLGKVADSGCTFVRAGKDYSGPEARRHLEFKLGFVRSRIDSADQFIRDLASASSSTGEAYHVRCGAVDSIAKPWMEAQLKALRGQR